ncbi:MULTISPECIES: hypothetical protein [Cyanophyceae]|uniref:hypothetical protein n=1 Tax=Cyanophyceae TaxID=3028117 RepID=UPI0016832F78|nr:hypothetical protein [Trichocoleus sp. FACHB-69]MBD1931539.1 hypothetical protein [Trichocoleus sp. FACHB-69]
MYLFRKTETNALFSDALYCWPSAKLKAIASFVKLESRRSIIPRFQYLPSHGTEKSASTQNV